MDDHLKLELREMAVKITTSYTRCNPVSVDTLPSVIQLAYQGLEACVAPPPPPEPPVSKRGRGGGVLRPRGKTGSR